MGAFGSCTVHQPSVFRVHGCLAMQLRDNTVELEEGPQGGHATQQGTAAYAEAQVECGADPQHFRTLSFPGQLAISVNQMC